MASNLLIYTNVPKVADERICPICSEEAPAGEVHHPHYGGICCYGCRAFFRRAHQRTKVPKLNCKGNGNCEIAPKGQARCKKCRYEKCLSVGMDPKWVMTNEQKRIRFQHYYKKKLERETVGGGENSRSSGASIGRGERHSSSQSSDSDLGHQSNSNSNDRFEAMEDIQPTHINQSQPQVPRQAARLTGMLPLALAAGLPFDRRPIENRDEQPPMPSPNTVSPLNAEIAAQRLLMIRGLTQDHSAAAEARGLLPRPAFPFGPRHGLLGLMMEQGRLNSSSDRPPQCYAMEQNHKTDARDELTQEPSRDLPYPLESRAPPPPAPKPEMRFADLLSLECQLTRLLDIFTLTVGRMEPTSKLATDLILTHQRAKPLSKMALISQLSKSASVITEFATSLAPFKRLDPKDQLTLLKSNVPLYLQYILARYFNARSGLDQLKWIFEGQVSFGKHSPQLYRIDLQLYQISADLFPRSDMAEMYGHYAENIDTFFRIPQSCNALVANLLLFRTTEETRSTLSDPDRVKQHFDEAVQLLRLGHEHLGEDLPRTPLDEEFGRLPENILSLIHALDTMKTIFDNCQVEDNDARGVSPDVAMSTFTETEQDWLVNRLNQFQSQYQSVEMSGDYVSQVVNLLRNGTPVGPHFVPSWMRMAKERARRTLKIHPEFEALSDFEQATIFNKNYTAFVALNTSYVDLCRTGKDQLKYVFGFFNTPDGDWEDEFGGVDSLKNLKLSHLHNPKVNGGKLDDRSISFYLDLMASVSDLLANPQLFQLLTLIALLDTDGLPDIRAHARIVKLRQIYLRLFQRKLVACGHSYIDYTRFKKTLQMVKIFATFMEAFLE